jgi:hypothetical protein
MQAGFFLEICVPVENLRRLILLDVCLQEFPKFVSEVCRPLLAADIPEDRMVHWILNIRQRVILQKL